MKTSKSGGAIAGDTRVVALCIVLLLGFASRLHAYTDPGTGVLLWQMLMAAFVGSLFYVRRLTAWIRRKAKSSKRD